MAGNNYHFCTAGPDLIHLFSGVINTLFVVAGYQRTAAAAATDLIHAGWVKVQPVFHALIQNPARFFKKSMPEAPPGFAAVIAGVMIGCRALKSGSVQFNAVFLYVLHQQIKNRYTAEFIKNQREMFFETRPGRQIGMASFGPQEVFDFQLLHLLIDTPGHDFHGFVITGEISPARPFPVFRRHSPVLTGDVKYLP